MNKQERIEQCKADIAKLQASLVELQDKKSPIKLGDIVDCECGRHIVLYDREGRLRAVDNVGFAGFIIPGERFYKRTGDNLFDNGLIRAIL